MTAYKTYEAERGVFGWKAESVSILEARDIADKICADFGQPPPLIKRSQNRNSKDKSWYWHPNDKYPNGRIALGTTAPAWIVCHEVAHYLNEQLGGKRGHGKDWKRIYVRCVQLTLGDRLSGRLHRAFRL